MERSPGHDVVVVGGGVVGLAVAWRALRAGYDACVVDPDPGRAATWTAAGMLAPVAEATFGEASLTRLALAAGRAWPSFAAELGSDAGADVHHVTDGALAVALDASDRAEVDRLHAYHVDLGLPAERLTGSAARAAEPLLAPGVCGGVLFPDDHQVDNRRVVAALLVAVARRGGTVVRDRVTTVEQRGGRAVGVTLSDGTHLAAGTVVLAAGSWSAGVDGVPGPDRPPVRPVRGVTLRLDAGDGPRLRRTVRGLVHGRACYLVPRPDGSVVVGATVEERGFDTAVRAGAVADLLDDARRLVPVVEEYRFDEASCALRPGTPDNGPVVGWTSTPGLAVATGHYRNGILLAPLTADEVVRLLPPRAAGPDRRPVDVDPEPFTDFRPDRFGGPGGATPAVHR